MSILDGHSCRMHNTNLKRQQVLLTLADPPSHSGREEGREGKSEICPDINPMDWFPFSTFSLSINVVFKCLEKVLNLKYVIIFTPGPHFSYKISLKSREISPFPHQVLSIENCGFPIHISLFFTVKKFANLAWKGIPESRFHFAKWEVWIKHEPWNKCYEKCAPGGQRKLC